MPKIAIQRKKAALCKLKINTQLYVYIPPMLDLNNCVATSVDHRYRDMSNWIEISEKCRKKTSKLRKNFRWYIVWPCSRVEPQKAREKLGLSYVQVSSPRLSLQSHRKPVPGQRSTSKKVNLCELKAEPAIWSCDTGQRIPCSDRCQLIKRCMSNIKDVCCKLAWYWSHWHTWKGRRTDVRMVMTSGYKPNFPKFS